MDAWIKNADFFGVIRVVRKANSSCYCVKNKLDLFSNPRITLKKRMIIFPLCFPTVYSIWQSVNTKNNVFTG